MLQERRIQRKLVGTNNFKNVNEYKQKEDELRELEVKFDNELEKLEVVEGKSKQELNEIEPIVVSSDYKPMLEVELKKALTGKYMLSPNVEKLNEYALYQTEKIRNCEMKYKSMRKILISCVRFNFEWNTKMIAV